MKITIERRDITIVHSRSGKLEIFCEYCRSTVKGMTPEQTADLYRVPVKEINGLLEATEIHLIKTSDGELPLICSGSSGK